MAESMVSLAIEKLAAFLAAEAGFLGSLQKDVTELKMELGFIKAFLKNAEKKAEEDDTINEWLIQVQTVAYDIEAVIDKFLLLKQQQKLSPQHSYHQVIWMISRIRSWLGKAVVCVSQLKPKHELSSKIKDIKTEVIEINNRRNRYQISTTEEEFNSQDPRVFSRFINDSEVFGIEDCKKELIQSMNSKLGNCFVIAVVGMGGIGKTTLVHKVYEEFSMNQSFDFHAWVTVSQSYKTRNLLMTICKQVHVESSLLVDASDDDEIISALRNHLKSTRYIVTFDDVWDAELLTVVKSALPPYNRGSKILVTTRERNIAREWEASLGGGLIYDLKPLPREAAWDLFTHICFGKGHCPQHLEEPTRDMVVKCNGLPLAIVAVAGLMCTKEKTISEWYKLRNSIGTEFGGNRRFERTKRILLLSYHELPYYLKPCFLYFGMFPEGFSINGKKLFRLWIAEGFIQHQQGKTLEEVAEDYVEELVNRKLVEVDVKNKFRVYKTSKRDISYKVHDILREMIIIPKSKNLGFSLHLGKESEFSSTNTKSFRRLSIDQNFANKCDLELLNSSITRTILSLSNPEIFSEPYLNSPKSPLRVARLIKVLDLDNAQIDNAPEEIGNLQHLQYLSLRRTNIKVLPKSIGNLWNLQTLDLKFSLIVELPEELAYCCKLRHLLAHPREIDDSVCQKTTAVKIPDKVLEKLKKLQKLAIVEASTASIVDGLWHLKQLRSLRMTLLRKEHGRRLCCAIEEMKHLRSLRIGSMGDDEILDIQHITTPPHQLERLYLHGLLEKLPYWVGKLKNLASLHLFSSRLKEDPLTLLQGLPNLAELTLDDAFVGEKLDFGNTSFSKLATLNLYQLYNLQSIDGPLPALEVGDIHECPKLQIHSERIEGILMHRRNLLRKIRASFRVTRVAYSFRQALDRDNQ